MEAQQSANNWLIFTQLNDKRMPRLMSTMADWKPNQIALGRRVAIIIIIIITE